MHQPAPASRSSSRSSSSPEPGGEPLHHALAALALSALSILLAWWTLWPDGASTGHGTGTVLAAAPQAASAPDHEPSHPSSISIASARGPRAGGEGTEGTPDSPDGLVLDQWGQPVAGAEVWQDDGSGWYLATHSQDDGSFPLPEGRARLGARHPGHAPSRVLDLEQGRAHAELVLGGPAASLELEVVDEAGRVLPGVEVRLAAARAGETGDSSPAARLTPAPPVRTDRSGRVQLAGLAAGQRTVTARHAGHSTRLLEVLLLEARHHHRRLVLPSSARISGRVTLPDGAPAAGARVEAVCIESWHRTRVVADESGGYELAELPASRLRLEATLEMPDGSLLRADSEQQLWPGGSEVWSPVLEAASTLRGRLVDDEGRPLEGWLIEQGGPPGEDRPGRRTRTDADGRYELPTDHDGQRLLVYHPLVRQGIPSRSIERSMRETTVEGDSLRAGILTGRVVRADRTAPARSLLLLRRLSDGATTHTWVGDDGSFATPPLPVGDYSAIFRHHGRGWCPERTWRVSGEGSHEVGLVVLPPLGTLALTAPSANRASETAHLRIELLRPTLGEGQRLLALAGAIETPMIVDLAPGLYRLSFPTRPELEPLEVVVQGGITTTLALPD